jgi:dipeptidase
MRRVLLPAALLVAALSAAPRAADACTNFLVTRGASADGSTMITYAADAHDLYGYLQYTPAGRHPAGSMRDVYEWDTGKYLGKIKQAPVTYAVVGNMNEHQVSVGETTFGGRKELEHGKGIIDYGSMMYIALERSKTAREALKVMVDLVTEHGYMSEGESISVSDSKEVWIFEIISRGPDTKGALWVARKVPDGYVCSHANKPRIRQFPLNDPQNTMYAKDVIQFARKKGWFSGRDEDFSFADMIDPPRAKNVRTCDSRVWSFFKSVAPSQKIPIDYVLGKEGAKPLPLWIKPDKKLTPHDLMEAMRDHFEGTPMDLSKGAGAGPHALPYRWRPLFWKVDGVEYMNERATSTQQTGFSFIAQARAWLPSTIGGIFWFGVDDTNSTVYVPIYAGVRDAPKAFSLGTVGHASKQVQDVAFTNFSWDLAFWVFNAVANYAYGRYDEIMVDVKKVQRELEGSFFARQPEIDEAALKLHKQAPSLARDFLTDYSAKATAMTMERWRKLFGDLVVKFMDGNTKDAAGKAQHPGYSEQWRRRVAKDCGDFCKTPHYRNEPPDEEAKPAPLPRCPAPEPTKLPKPAPPAPPIPVATPR